MIRKRRKQLIYFYLLSDILAITVSFFLTFFLRFYSGVLKVPKGIPHYEKYFLVLPFLIVVQILYFTYMGYYKVKLRRNRLDDLFLVFFNTVLSAVAILLIDPSQNQGSSLTLANLLHSNLTPILIQPF